MTLKSGTDQACAACKYQRRRCTSDCSLAPHFPADQPKIFQNVHKLFGVKNILKILKPLDPTQRVLAMRSIKYQANMRDRFLVYGCLVEIQQLYCQVQACEDELRAVLAQLAFFRQNHQLPDIDDQPLSHLQSGVPTLDNSLSLVPQDNKRHQSYREVAADTYSDNDNPANYDINIFDSKPKSIVNSLWIQQTYSNNNSHNNNASSVLTTPDFLSVQQEMAQDYDEIKPFFYAIDDRQSYIGSREAYESSSESSIKDSRHTIEQMTENELKNAAACFSLTNVN